MKILGIIQARMNSTRLPNKVLMEVSGSPVLEHILNRVLVSNIDEIVIATTVDSRDDLIDSFCKSKNVNCFRGDELNVLKRFYDCAKKYHGNIIVRITADDPFKDPNIINHAIKLLLDNQLDYVSNTIEASFPEGLDIEVFTFEALERAFKFANLSSEKEHVTPYIWKNTGLFKTYNFKNNTDLSDLRWTLDTLNDLKFVEEIYNRLYNSEKKIFLMNDNCCICFLILAKEYAISAICAWMFTFLS